MRNKTYFAAHRVWSGWSFWSGEWPNWRRARALTTHRRATPSRTSATSSLPWERSAKRAPPSTACSCASSASSAPSSFSSSFGGWEAILRFGEKLYRRHCRLVVLFWIGFYSYTKTIRVRNYGNKYYYHCSSLLEFFILVIAELFHVSQTRSSSETPTFVKIHGRINRSCLLSKDTYKSS